MDVQGIRAALAVHKLAPEVHAVPERPKWCEEQLWGLAEHLDALPEVVDAIEAGRDLRRVVDEWMLWLLTVELGTYSTSKPVAVLYRRRLAGDEPTKEEWRAARAGRRRRGRGQ